MKVGIFISGLGQSYVNESVEKYSSRLMHELNCNTNGKKFSIKTEKIKYSEKGESTLVNIYESKNPDLPVYKLYEFSYHKLLTEQFNKYPLIIKNVFLFILVLRKFPIALYRIFVKANHSRPGQAFYVFFIFLIIALTILFTLPTAISILFDYFNNEKVQAIFEFFKNNLNISIDPNALKVNINEYSKLMVSMTALILILIPQANILVTNLATEFVCANDFLQHGNRKQIIMGNLELLVDYISEVEENSEIHFHTYSFGSMVAMEYLFPVGNRVSANAKKFSKALVTIGTPFEFISSYYPGVYKNRNVQLDDQLTWINVYSSDDALATNFRKDGNIGEAEFGVNQTSSKPINKNYEIAPSMRFDLINFLSFYYIRVHGMYWDEEPEGQSCVGLIYDEMIQNELIIV